MFTATFILFLMLSSLVKFLQAMPTKTGTFPKPFTRQLKLQQPQLKGKDVTILQNLLSRSKFAEHIELTSTFDEQTRDAVARYQKGNFLNSTGILDMHTASMVLTQLMYDGYKDDRTVPHGFKFKLYIPVHKNRNIETKATLYDGSHKAMYSFIVRCHGHTDVESGLELNQLTTNGNTPTGLMTFDLNTPEPNPKSFGPYPVVRAVKGLQGNAAIGRDKDDTFLPNYRNGILLHTGEWTNWNSSQPMPNSNGCIHAHPMDLKTVDEILTRDLGVVIRDNPFGKLPYPYEPQGLLSIEQVEPGRDRV